MRVIELTEDTPSVLSPTELTQEEALAVHKRFGAQVDVSFPTVITDNCYALRPSGYVGQLPISNDLLIRIAPKIPITNIFGMLEYAYNLKSFKLFEGVVDVAVIEDLFEQLAAILARRVLGRVRKGLYSSYIKEEDDLPYVRGRIAIAPTVRGMLRGATTLSCQYEEHTADVEDNRILAWTLYCLRKLPFKRQSVQRDVRQAYLALAGTITVTPAEALECVNRFYHRLNDDYEPMHGLCRLFLEHLGPGIEAGEHVFLPYIVDMPILFETFVAQWLKEHMPSELQVTPHYRVKLEANVNLTFDMDIVVSSRATRQVLAILDTKYKRAAQPDEADISQVTAYALQMHAPKAILIYPSSQTQPIEARIGDISVQSLIFDIRRQDLGGDAFLSKLMSIVAPPSAI
jgi:5-methylcytosine-specific restriction enzyme subunit McrC